MDAAEKVMIACLLLSEGAEDDAVRGFISALEEGLALGEQDSIEMRHRLLERMKGPLPDGPAGAVIRLMKAKLEHDAICRKFGMAASGLTKALRVLSSPAQSDFAARILVSRALSAISEAKLQIAG